MALSIGDDDDLLGALDIGDLEYLDSLADVGRRRRSRGGVMTRRGQGPAGRGNVVPYRRIVPTIPGVPMPGMRLQPFGLPSIVFTATSGTALLQSARPQRPFKAKRLIIAVTRVGTTSTGAVTVTQLQIGVSNQFVGSGPLPVEMFAAGSFDTNLELSAATTALDITVAAAVGLPAITTTDTITLAIGFIGESAGA